MQLRITGTPATGDNPDDMRRLQGTIAETLDNLDSAESSVSVIQARVGAPEYARQHTRTA